MSEWHIITCEYPPQVGGVSDYTKLVAEGLTEAGDEVHVWCPGEEQEAEGGRQEAAGRRQEAGGRRQTAGVKVHRDLGRFRPSDLRRVGKQLDQFPLPRRLLVQWVPHGYGYRSMNLPFCLWLWRRAKFKGDRVELMVHEPFLAFREGSRKQDVAAAAHRLMIVLLLNAASHIWISTQSWEKHLRPFLFGRKKPIEWLPVPNNIPVVDDHAAIRQTRAKYATNGTRLIGHFGAYSKYMSDIMSEFLPAVLNGGTDLSMLLLGKGSSQLRDSLVSAHPEMAPRIHATGEISAEEISKHVSACDVMWQPYQDGVSGRRTSVMSALSHGIATVTTAGKATERCWLENDAVKLTEPHDVNRMIESVRSVIEDDRERLRLGSAGSRLYANFFQLREAVRVLRDDKRS
jgi:glycosyltransferase involved in cell wall biosynthesis